MASSRYQPRRDPLTTQRTTDNLDLAASAREMADGEPAGTLGHTAAASVAITFATTRDVAQARNVLDGVTPDEVRRAALEIFERLTTETG
jgi:hypothetical protein